MGYVFHLALRSRKHESDCIPPRCHCIVVLRLLLRYVHLPRFDRFTLQRESYFLLKVVGSLWDGRVLLR